MLFRIVKLAIANTSLVVFAIACLVAGAHQLNAQPPSIASTVAYPIHAEEGRRSQLDWWRQRVTQSVLEQPEWVSFDLETVLLDTLENSPRIQIVSRQASVALEKIIQQDAAFDPTLLFESRVGRTNDPVGNSLITGGPPRLIEESLTTRGGVRRSGRRGTVVNLSQELGLLDSNSNFFSPANQGNARLGINLSQPLLSRGGQAYNERLLTQARIDSNVSWQEMRGGVEQNIADVVAAYWKLYEIRCHYLQQVELLSRGKRVEQIVMARRDFDAGQVELAKARQRVARRTDRKLLLEAEVRKQQTRLASLVGSEELSNALGQLEMIPLESPDFPQIKFELRDAVVQGIENRPEVRAAAAELESAALSIQVTRAELTPQLTAVVDTYLSGLNGNNRTTRSFTDQFTTGGPGMSAGLAYDMPYRRRAAKSRHREARHLYQQRNQELREAIQLTRAEIENALIEVETTMAQQETKRHLLVTAIDEEEILTRRWEMMAGDGSSVGTVLENLLDAQQRRTDAEREWITVQSQYLVSLVNLQRAMGTLLTRKGIQPVQHRGDTTVDFIQSDAPLHNSTLFTPISSRPSQQPTRPTSSTRGDTKR
jgi:outer membrane protein TolC